MRLTALELARLVAILTPYRNETLTRPTLELALALAKEARA